MHNVIWQPICDVQFENCNPAAFSIVYTKLFLFSLLSQLSHLSLVNIAYFQTMQTRCLFIFHLVC